MPSKTGAFFFYWEYTILVMCTLYRYISLHFNYFPSISIFKIKVLIYFFIFGIIHRFIVQLNYMLRHFRCEFNSFYFRFIDRYSIWSNFNKIVKNYF